MLSSTKSSLVLALAAGFAAVTAHHAHAEAEMPAADGTWSMGGAVRGRLDVLFDASSSNGTTSHRSFDTLILKVGYDSNSLFGTVKYRFYGGSYPYLGAPYKGHFGEVNFPEDAYVGYKINPNSRVTAGLNLVPFGSGQFFSSTFYQTLGFVIGIEDVHNVGIKYSYSGDPLSVQFGYYPVDGGNWVGNTKDSDRHSTNIVKADSYVFGGSNNVERNMLIGRGAYTIAHSATMTSEFGLSGWYSSIHNFDTHQDGGLKRLAEHFTGRYGSWQITLLAARQDISAKNPADDRILTVGGLSGSYNMAAKGNLYSADVIYNTLGAIGPVTNIAPYLSYSAFLKDESSFKTSQRLIPGIGFTIAQLPGVYAYVELLVGKNDPYVGAGQYVNGVGAGASNQWKKALYANIGYYF
ncbi:MAG: hypothetical protein D4S02_15875 [Rhodocyclaceae bacterium]|nr:MAG: hypothetical protein D4S02_15875 [Rhodocyclaceae bacterium]